MAEPDREIPSPEIPLSPSIVSPRTHNIWSHVFADFTPMEVLQNPLKGSSRINYSSIAVSQLYLALGATTGAVYVFSRSDLKYLLLIPGGKEGSVTHVVLGPDDYVAYCTSQGYLVIMDMNLQSGKQPQRVRVTADHKGHTVTAVCWGSRGDRVFVGDDRGKVTATLIVGKTTKGLLRVPSEVIMQVESSIVQIDSHGDWVLVSSLQKTYLANTAKQQFTNIGKKPREGPYGACFYPSLSSPHPQVYCGRPGSRLWQADHNGAVLTTHQLKKLLDIPAQPIIDARWSTMPEALHASSGPLSLVFQKIMVICDVYLLCVSEACLVVVNPNTGSVLLWAPLSDVVHQVKCLGSEVYILYSNNSVQQLRFLPVLALATELLNSNHISLTASLVTSLPETFIHLANHHKLVTKYVNTLREHSSELEASTVEHLDKLSEQLMSVSYNSASDDDEEETQVKFIRNKDGIYVSHPVNKKTPHDPKEYRSDKQRNLSDSKVKSRTVIGESYSDDIVYKRIRLKSTGPVHNVKPTGQHKLQEKQVREAYRNSSDGDLSSFLQDIDKTYSEDSVYEEADPLTGAIELFDPLPTVRTQDSPATDDIGKITEKAETRELHRKTQTVIPSSDTVMGLTSQPAHQLAVNEPTSPSKVAMNTGATPGNLRKESIWAVKDRVTSTARSVVQTIKEQGTRLTGRDVVSREEPSQPIIEDTNFKFPDHNAHMGHDDSDVQASSTPHKGVSASESEHVKKLLQWLRQTSSETSDILRDDSVMFDPDTVNYHLNNWAIQFNRIMFNKLIDPENLNLEPNTLSTSVTTGNSQEISSQGVYAVPDLLIFLPERAESIKSNPDITQSQAHVDSDPAETKKADYLQPSHIPMDLKPILADLLTMCLEFGVHGNITLYQNDDADDMRTKTSGQSIDGFLTNIEPSETETESDVDQGTTSEESLIFEDERVFVLECLKFMEISKVFTVIWSLENHVKRYHLWMAVMESLSGDCDADGRLSGMLRSGSIEQILDALQAGLASDKYHLWACLFRIFSREPLVVIDFCARLSSQVPPLHALYMCISVYPSETVSSDDVLAGESPELQSHKLWFYFVQKYMRIRSYLLKSKAELLRELCSDWELYCMTLQAFLQNNHDQLKFNCSCGFPRPHAHKAEWPNPDVLSSLIGWPNLTPDQSQKVSQLLYTHGYWLGYLKRITESPFISKQNLECVSDLPALILQLDDRELLDRNCCYGYHPSNEEEWCSLLKLKARQLSDKQSDSSCAQEFIDQHCLKCDNHILPNDITGDNSEVMIKNKNSSNDSLKRTSIDSEEMTSCDVNFNIDALENTHEVRDIKNMIGATVPCRNCDKSHQTFSDDQYNGNQCTNDIENSVLNSDCDNRETDLTNAALNRTSDSSNTEQNLTCLSKTNLEPQGQHSQSGTVLHPSDKREPISIQDTNASASDIAGTDSITSSSSISWEYLIGLMLEDLGAEKCLQILKKIHISSSLLNFKLLKMLFHYKLAEDQQAYLAHEMLEKFDTHLWSSPQSAVLPQHVIKAANMERQDMILHGKVSPQTKKWFSDVKSQDDKFSILEDHQWGITVNCHSECAVCGLGLLDGLSLTDSGVDVLSCGHSFHAYCLAQSDGCPLCLMKNLKLS